MFISVEREKEKKRKKKLSLERNYSSLLCKARAHSLFSMYGRGGVSTSPNKAASSFWLDFSYFLYSPFLFYEIFLLLLNA